MISGYWLERNLLVDNSAWLLNGLFKSVTEKKVIENTYKSIAQERKKATTNDSLLIIFYD